MNLCSRGYLRLIAFMACTVFSFSTASAHFLFVMVGPLGEGGRRAEVFFSEKADAGDPMFIGKLTGTRLWRQTQPGSFAEIPVRPASDRLVAPLPGSESVGVVGICEYGVRAVAGRTPFLLRYYPKAVAGTAAEVNALKPRTEIPFEITARFGNDFVEFTVFAEGKPVPGAKLTTVDLDLVNETLITGAEGRVRWKPSRGEYSVYTDRTVKTPGESNGSKYEEIREFATIAFRFPLEREGVDVEAVSAFENAVAARAQWVGFPGFRASISGVIDGRDFSGKVEVPADGKAKLEIDDSAHASWIIDQLSSIVLHRRAESSRSAQGRPTLRYADEDEIHPLGRLLEFEGGRFAST
jgi:hypothetical protein